MSTLRKLCVYVPLLASIMMSGMVGSAASVTQNKPIAFQVQDITPSNLNWYINTMPRRIHRGPHVLTRWDTTTTDQTATWPDATDPTRSLPISVQAKFACIRWHESRNHLFSVNKYTDAGGWYQFTPYIWRFARAHLPGLPALPQKANGDQQSRVAIWYYHRNHGFYPEWAGDMGSCS